MTDDYNQFQEPIDYDGDDSEDEDGYCQDCGDYISFSDGTAYVTASGDVFCRSCGRAVDEEQERMDDEDGFGWEYSTGYDLIEDEEYGVYIGPENDTMGKADPPINDIGTVDDIPW